MKNRCMGCMQELTVGGVCPKCAFDNLHWTNPARALPLRTVLNGKYLIGAVIGEGGFGITYVAWDMLINSKVAIKEYFPSELATRDVTYINSNMSRKSLTLLNGANERLMYKKGLERFVQEAEKLAKFRQLTGIVSVQDFFYENNTAYMVMEYIEGTTLSTYLQDHGEKLPAEEALQMMKPVLSTLSAVHKEGIVHRDISPDNIMITKNGQMKLIDFGAARYVGGSDEKSLTVILKHGYAPEEQYRSDGKQGPWTDVYALCAVIFRMITGKVPVEPIQRMTERQDSVEKELLDLSGLNAMKRKALIKGLAVKREKRYQSVSDLYMDLYEQRKELQAKQVWGMVAGIFGAVVLTVSAIIVSKQQEENYETEESGFFLEEELVNVPSSEEVVEATTTEEMEPEYIGGFREYYNANFGREGDNLFFGDMTGDGQDELIVTRQGIEEGGSDIQHEIWIFHYRDQEVVQLYHDWGMVRNDYYGYAVEYFLKFDGGTACIYKSVKGIDSEGCEEKVLTGIEFEEDANGTIRSQEMLISSTGEETLYDGVIRISTDHKWADANFPDDYEAVLERKNILESVRKIGETAKGLISCSGLIHNGEEQCILAVVAQPEENPEYGENQFSVWYLDDAGIGLVEEKIDSVDNWLLNSRGFYDCEIYQFGRSEHFFLTLGMDQLKYCYEDGAVHRKSPDFSFLKEQDGRVVAEFWPDIKNYGDESASGILAKDYAPIYYYDSQYVEYGCKEVSISVLEEYQNHQDIIKEMNGKFMELDRKGWDMYGQECKVDKVEIVNVMKSAENYYYVNCRVQGKERYYEGEYHDDFDVWGYAELFGNGMDLELRDVRWGKREEHSDLGLTVYYEDGSIEVPAVEWESPEVQEISFVSESADPNLPDEVIWRQLYVEYVLQDMNGGMGSSEPGDYALAYVDDDEIPELYRNGKFAFEGAQLFTVKGGRMIGICGNVYGISYVERGNILIDSGGRMDHYYDDVYMLQEGHFEKLHEGISSVYYSEGGEEEITIFHWDGKRVGGVEYGRVLEQAAGDEDLVKASEQTCSAEEMLQILMTME